MVIKSLSLRAAEEKKGGRPLNAGQLFESPRMVEGGGGYKTRAYGYSHVDL